MANEVHRLHYGCNAIGWQVGKLVRRCAISVVGLVMGHQAALLQVQAASPYSFAHITQLADI
eukprot:2478677-Amphidinium_carterae.1